jgi:hypothetical protein
MGVDIALSLEPAKSRRREERWSLEKEKEGRRAPRPRREA